MVHLDPPVANIEKDLVGQFSKTDPKVNAGVLEVAHSIFVRWRPLFQSTELVVEISHVLKTFGEPYLQLLIVSSAEPSTASVRFSNE
jgi:exportin-2 (importin alpha re-exporter)